MKKIGKVVEVFIPTEYENDIMNSKKIGFKVKLDNEIIEIIQKQNEDNCQIMKNDLVLITKEKIGNKGYIDIHLIDGDDYE
ncbi:MAG: hypothetical protein IKF91_01665 [Bacilli bacterium]|nr:hypothetical protein [Bacilli bacterium]